MATLLQPGRISPLRQVPASVTAPEYVGRRYPKLGEPDVKDAGTIERMRVAGKLAAQALAEVGRAVAPGVTTDELDRVGHEFLISHGATRARWLPRLPEVAVHLAERGDLPRHTHDTVIENGDIVNVDITAFIGGVHGDTNATFPKWRGRRGIPAAGRAHPEAMMRGVRAVAPR